MGPEMGPNLDGNEVLRLTIMGEAVWKKSRHPKGQREIDLQWYEWRGKDFPFHGVQEAAGSNPVTRTKSVFRKEYGLSFFSVPSEPAAS